MRAYVFPGQGSQFPGMGKDLFDASEGSKEWFSVADRVLGFSISKMMFEGTEEDLKQTRVTQPAIFVHSVIKAFSLGDSFQPDMVAGHSLGEFSALVASGSISFEDGLQLVLKRAMAMQKACEATPSTMAAVLGLSDEKVEEVCARVQSGVVVAANYNCPGQLVISGAMDAVKEACELLTAEGAKRALLLPVGGAFHSPLMEPARIELEAAIQSTEIKKPNCPIYQNVTAAPETDPDKIRINLVKQLTSPVRWTQTIQRMVDDGAKEFIEVGPGKVLQGLVRKISREVEATSV